MFKITPERVPGGFKLTFQEEKRWALGLLRKMEFADLRAWSKASGASASLARDELMRLENSDPDLFRADGHDLFIADDGLARLSNNALKALNLYGNPDADFSLEQKGSLRLPEFALVPKWTKGGATMRTSRDGVVLNRSGIKSIIPEPIWSILKEIDAARASGLETVAQRMEHAATVLDLVRPQESRDDLEESFDFEDEDARQTSIVRLEGALQNFKVKTAKSLSIRTERGTDGFHSMPVLFGKKSRNEAGEISESDSLLNVEERATFEHHEERSFLAFSHAKRSYLLDSGEYLLIDEDLLPALEYVREVDKQSPEERQAFAENPVRALVGVYRARLEARAGQALSDDLHEEQVENLISRVFVETKEYSERVLGLGLWVPPVLPYIQRPPNSWEPEEFGVYIGEDFIALPPDQITELRDKVEVAIAEGKPTVEHQQYKIPATQATLDTLEQLQGMVRPSEPEGDGDAGKTKPERQALLVKENFDEDGYKKAAQKRFLHAASRASSKVTSTLMEHQQKALDWQIDAYLTGLPGILNADDQGLGKTLQSIAFTAWLQDNMRAGPDDGMKPILVVAPTALLKNWAEEVETHMGNQFGLGARIDAYGSGLKAIKREDENGNITIDLGIGNDVRPENRICWVLTTYTTLTENHIEFAKIDFGCVIFDEIQNIKNPATLAHRAAQVMKSDFTIGLTGTPVENHIADLWAISDVLSPGFFGPLKAFVDKYGGADEATYEELNKQVFKAGYWAQADGTHSVPMGIRRMKTDEIKDLPLKKYRLHPAEMPKLQAEAYTQIFHRLQDGAKGRALKMLHQLRSVSLYPGQFKALEEDPDALQTMMDNSARIKKTVEILDEICDAGQKVLIFLETRELQYLLARLLSERYGLDSIPIINGETSPHRRGKIVSDFQKVRGDGRFDIRILGPRSAGVGLTLTAAQHVIHLSRWWNPAIEEQCNDRIFRIGQDMDVTIHIPIAVHPEYMSNSFDCILNDIMIRKRQLFQRVLMPMENARQDQSDVVAGLTGANGFDISQIDALDWKRFENWVGKEAENTGLWEYNQTPRTGDGGADSHLRHKLRKDIVLVQCKFTEKDEKYLGEAPIHEVLHSKGRYPSEHGQQCVVITNGTGYTKAAIDLAARESVILIDRNNLALWPKHVI